MAVVDIDAVWFEDIFELIDEWGSGGLYTKDVVDLGNIVAVGFVGIYFRMSQAGSQIGTLSLEDDVLPTFLLFLVDFFLVAWSHH
jgi:hypothetical protein